MGPRLLPAAFAVLFLVALALPPEVQDHPTDASRVVAEHRPEPGARDAATRVAAARAFLATLGEEQRARCVYSLDGEERRDWTNLPPGRDESGLRLGELEEAQIRAVLDLLAASLSEQGYAEVCDIMLADDRLLRDGQPRVGFGVAEFWILLFGDPTEEGAWGLQLDGHHLGLNLTFEGERMTHAPSLVGTQPARYRRGEEVVAPLADELDPAFALVNALTDEQRARAVVSEERGRILAGPGRDDFVPEPAGLQLDELDAEQRAHVKALLAAYVNDLPEAAARPRLAALEGEIDRMHLAWSGPTEPDGLGSFRLKGPTVLVEYAPQDRSEPPEHLHSIYRDPKGDYGDE